MKFFERSHDGGKDSGVEALFVVEIKSLFSIAILRFNTGTREAFHSHAFNALTWWLRGSVREEFPSGASRNFTPSLIPKFTPRGKHHRIHAFEPTYAITFRGPWKRVWEEIIGDEVVTLTDGRRIIERRKIEDANRQ